MAIRDDEGRAGRIGRPAGGPEVSSFYHLADTSLQGKFCTGLGCFAAQRLNPERWRLAVAQHPRVYCLGKCFAAPSCADDPVEPLIEARCPEPIILAGLAGGAVRSLENYGGYSSHERALSIGAKAVLQEMERSQLRGRGGAGFPAWLKWRAVAEQPGPVKYVVANADEGDHGSYIDKLVIENAPHRLLEAMAIAAFAVGASSGVIYLRKEYPVAFERLQVALQEARSAGLLGPSFDVQVVVGQGSYVCGEETSLLNSIEHRRPEVRVRPPFPTQSGLFGMPTLVANVETLSNVPWIVQNGGDAYGARGFSKSRGTKAISLSSLFVRPGLYEIEFGEKLETIVHDIGGGLKTGEMKALIVGGPLAGLIHPSELGTRFGFEEMAAIGASVGHGGIVAFDHNTRIIDLLAHAFAFGADESCGKCTPCRLGSRYALNAFVEAARGQSPDRAVLKETISCMKETSLCGHGSGLGVLAESAFAKFGEELEL